MYEFKTERPVNSAAISPTRDHVSDDQNQEKVTSKYFYSGCARWWSRSNGSHYN